MMQQNLKTWGHAEEINIEDQIAKNHIYWGLVGKLFLNNISGLSRTQPLGYF